ncbi:MAG: LysM peptidoglycan-binding domain-containing protein, partial [Anaerolineae bacterium]|nr:LysM peptidoglycan-binding domain-containing protein [Anaerolineae bacterium]
FNDCVTRLNNGDTIEACLNAYPQFAEELRPMLLTSQTVRQSRIDANEVHSAQIRGRAHVLDAMQSAARPYEQPRRGVSLLQLGALAASLLLVLSIFLGGTLMAENSLPGDPLYNYKRLTEQVRKGLANDPQVLEEAFSERRVMEVHQLMALRRVEDVAFSGVVESQVSTQWQVADLSLTVPDGVPGAANIQVGPTVAIDARTTLAGALVAEEIRLVEDGTEPPPTPVQEPNPTPTVTPSPTAQPSETPTVTLTLEPTRTPTPMPAVTLCIPALPEDWIIYQVQPGDTLSNLANQTNTTLDQLMQINCLSDSGLIVSGENIFLPFIPAQPTGSFTDDNNVGDSSGNVGSSGDDQNDHEDDDSEDPDEPEHEDD